MLKREIIRSSAPDTRVMASRICCLLVVKSTYGPGGGIVTSDRRSSRGMPLTNSFSAEMAPRSVCVSMLLRSTTSMMSRPGRRSVLLDTYGSRSGGCGCPRRRGVGDELRAHDAARLPVDGHGELRHAEIAHRHALAIDDRDVDFHDLDAGSEDRRLGCLRV